MAIGNTSILLVEQRLIDLIMLETVLCTVPGVALHVAQSGIKAMQLVARVEPTLLLIALDLPDMGGCELLAALRTAGTCDSARAIALTADGETDAMRCGFDAVWTKPLDSRGLLSRCRALGLMPRIRLPGM